jgi:hypothetical protein
MQYPHPRTKYGVGSALPLVEDPAAVFGGEGGGFGWG